MKKMNNKGFSLVELIIVIAIMAILAGAIAPALIKYINKSRKSADVNNAQTIATAVTNALAQEAAYDDCAAGTYNVSSLGSTAFPTAVAGDLSPIPTPKFDKNAGHFDVVVTVAADGSKTFKVMVGSDELYPDVAASYK